MVVATMINKRELRDAFITCAVGTVIAVLFGYAFADCTLPGPTNNVFPPPWPGLLGDAAGLNFPSTPGAACGNTLIGAPLLSDTEAAAQARSAPASTMDGVNRAANNYQPSPGELAAYHSMAPAWAQRVDGQCQGLGPNPTTTAVLEWAALKWGIDPRLAWAEALVESHWDQRAIGDAGGSHGILQVNDRPANRPGGADHGDPALANLTIAQTSTCFNADAWAGRVYAVFNGLTNGSAPSGNLNAAIQSWYDGIYMVQHGGDYSGKVCAALRGNAWREFLNG